MAGNVAIQDLTRLSRMPNSDNSAELIAGQSFNDVYFTGGSISGVTLTNVIQANTVRVVSAAGAVTTSSTDYIVEIKKSVPEATSVTGAPNTLGVGVMYTLNDGNGDCDIYPITLTPSTGTINGQASFELNNPYQSIVYYWNGTMWRIR